MEMHFAREIERERGDDQVIFLISFLDHEIKMKRLIFERLMKLFQRNRNFCLKNEYNENRSPGNNAGDRVSHANSQALK